MKALWRQGCFVAQKAGFSVQTMNSCHLSAQLCDTPIPGCGEASYGSQKQVFLMLPSEGFMGSGENCVMFAPVFLSVTRGSTGICSGAYPHKPH